MAASNHTVSVIIVTCNSLPSVLQCLHRLVEGVAEISCQIIIVDNASVDGTLEAVCRAVPTAVVIRNPKNYGFANGCNQGAAAAHGEYLLFLNPDVEIDPGAVARLTMIMQSTRKVGFVVGRLRYPDGTFQANCRNFPTVTNLLFSRGSVMARLLLNRLMSRTGLYTLPDYDDVTEVPAVAATMAMIRRDLFNRMRGFDPRFFLYMEDTDLSLRLHYAGYSNLFVPDAGGVHGFGKGAKVGRLRRSWHHHQSVWKYFLKHQPNGFSLLLLPVLLMCNFLIGAAIPSRGRR